MSAPPIPIIPGLAAIADRYDALILDLWGVLHDGVEAYVGATECLARLRAAGKRMAILSNAPRRAEEVRRRTTEIGIPPELYDVLHCSGEETWIHLKERPDAFYRRLGRSCFHLGPARDRGLLAGLDLQETADVTRADFVLNTGAHMAHNEVADFEPVLAPAAALDLPMVCANPDLEVIRGGQREICAGMLALRYEELGGRVRYHGKPHADVYARCLGLLALPAGARVLSVGDSLRTDIAGASASGLASLLITGGIHAEELGLAAGDHPNPRILAEVCARARQVPTFAAPAFVW